MAKRMKQAGKRYAATAEISLKQKIMAIVLLTVLLSVLVIESALSFFSDVVIAAANTVLGTVEIEIIDVYIEDEDEDMVAGIDAWTLGDVNNFEWTIRNNGRSAVRTTNTLRIAWEEEDLSVADVVFVYPATMTDAEIRTDIAENDGLDAIISHDIGLTTFEFQDDDIRTGFEFELPGHVYLSGSEETTGTAPPNHTFEFKIAFGLRENSSQQMTYINQFIGEYLKVEMGTRANLINGATRMD